MDLEYCQKDEEIIEFLKSLVFAEENPKMEHRVSETGEQWWEVEEKEKKSL